MFKRTAVGTAVAMAMAGGWVTVAVAQDAARVEITGSRIKTVETEAVSPIVTLGAEAIRVEGVRDVESLLNNLPQVFADQGGQVSNGATGTATVNLRNLGAGRTLVLVNGRRLPAGSPRSLPSDLNQIPVSLIKRVEVLTGGASAIYGSDAVAGVVNFVMNDKFTGLMLEANGSFFNHSQQQSDIAAIVTAKGFTVPGNKSADGKSNDFSITAGANFADNKGNATVYLGRKLQNPLLQSERDFTSCALNYSASNGWSCGGSGTSFPGRFLSYADFSSYTVADSNGGVRAWSSTKDVYNFAPLNYFQRPSERYSGAAYVNYDVSPAARVYAELNFHDDHTVAQIAPSGLFGVDAVVNYDNPFLSSAWKSTLGLAKSGDTAELLIFRRNVEGGGRQDDIRHTSYRGVMGVKGDLNANWSYDVSAQIGRVIYQETYKNDFSISRIGKALDVVVDPSSGKAVCRSKLDGTDTNCVPYNIWALGKIDTSALGYLQTPGFQKGYTAQSVQTATVNGDLTSMGIKSPMAKNGASVAVGVERRTEDMDLSTDTAFTTGDLAGQGGPTIGVGGKYSVSDVFAEMRFPLVEKRPMVELLNLTGSYRRSNYSTGKNTDTYGVGMEWSPVKSVKFRGSYQQASRAANVIELYAAQSLGLYDNDADPCAGSAPTATAVQCARTGVTSAQYGKVIDSPAGQYNYISGGNTNLNPETSNSYTLGVVLNPVKDLNVTLDAFNMKVKNTISSVGPTVILQQCLETGNPVFCGAIHRDKLGTLWATSDAYITATNANLGQLQTQGLDVGADYGMGLGKMGRLDLSFLGTYLKSFVVNDLPGLASYDCAGLFGSTCGTPLPEWRHKLRGTWTTPWNVSVAATWRHIDSVGLDSATTQARLTGSTTSQVKTLAARDYLDLAASYNLTKNITARVAINNLLDKDPPLRTQGSGLVNGNTYPVVYDAEGRRFSFNLSAKF